MKNARNMVLFGILALFLVCGTVVSGTAATETVSTGTVAAAASLQSFMEKVVPWFNEQNKSELQGVYGASGNLARQIESGAPFDLFLSADEKWARYVGEKGLLNDAPLPFAAMPLVLWHAGETAPSLDLLTSDTLTVAIANPETAPFGKRAQAYLTEKGLFEEIEKSGRLILGGDVTKTGLAAKSGGADLAILPLSTAAVLGEGTWTLLDAEPQTLFGGIIKDRGTPVLEAFWAFLRSPEAVPFLEEFGFIPPR